MGRKLLTLGTAAAMSVLAAGTAFAGSSDYEYITDVEFYADIDYDSSTDFEAEFYTDTDGIDDLEVEELSSSSSTIKKYKLVFTADTDDDYRFETGSDLTVTGENLYSITSVSVGSSGKKLTVKVQVKYNSSATKTKTGTGSSSSSSTGATAVSVSTGTSAATEGWTGSGDVWRYLNADGTYASGWVQDDTGWYYCDPNLDNTMKAGLFVDSDGNTYYLDESHDGTYGKMLTGWRTVDGRNCYFQPESGAPMGAMAKNKSITIGDATYTFDADGNATAVG